GNRHDEIQSEKRNQHERDSNSPIVKKYSSEINEVSRNSPQHSLLVLYIAPGFEIGVGNQPESRPNIVRKIPEEVQPAGSIVGAGGDSIFGSAVLFVVQTNMNRPAQFRKVPIQISEKEFHIPAEDPIVFPREVPLGAVRLHVFGAEHPD